MATSLIETDLYIKGTFRADTISLNDGEVGDDNVEAGAGIAASKLEHQHVIRYSQADGSDIVAATVPVYTVRGSTAEIIGVEVVCVDAPEGGDKAFSVDLHKADEGTPTPATVLTGTIAYSSTQSDCEVEAGTIDSADLVEGDTLLVIVAVSGSTGNQGQGLVVNVHVREDAD